MSNEVAALHVADEPFLVATTIERCPKTMMIRELVMNAIESAVRAPQGNRQIEMRTLDIGGVQKLSIWNTGPGMSSEELYQSCDIASSIGKEKGLDGNFGMGAKVASLPSNRVGLRYRSNKGGIVSEVILGERGGVYGRIRRPNSYGELEEVFDVTQAAKAEGADLANDWTEVVLFGNRPDQNTVRDPYNGDPNVTGQWLADYVYYRFFRIPTGVVLRFLPGTHKLDGARTFRTIPDRAYPMGRHESVAVQSDIDIHYFFDPPLEGTSHNKSVSGAITSDVSTCAIVFKDELYDLKRSRQWTLDAPLFGIPFGAKHISVHVELSDNFPARPEAYRESLRYRDGDQQQVRAQDFASLVLTHRPAWLVDVIAEFAPNESADTNDIRDELQRLLNSLRVRSKTPKIAPQGELEVTTGASGGARPFRDGEKSGEGQSPRLTLDDLLAVPDGARRATMNMNAERAPEITPLRLEVEIEEKGLKGRAARYYREAGQLFVNMRYPAIELMSEQLQSEYAGASDLEFMRRMSIELSERAMMIRVGRAVVYAAAKQLNHEWTHEDVTRAQSPESLSLAADDFVDAMQNARRRMGQALRTAGRQDVPQLQSADP